MIHIFLFSNDVDGYLCDSLLAGVTLLHAAVMAGDCLFPATVDLAEHFCAEFILEKQQYLDHLVWANRRGCTGISLDTDGAVLQGTLI